MRPVSPPTTRGPSAGAWVGWNVRRSPKAVTGKRYERLREMVLFHREIPVKMPSASRGAASNLTLVTGEGGYIGSVGVDEFRVLLASSNSPLVQASTAPA